jgi:hypothetical protein
MPIPNGHDEFHEHAVQSLDPNDFFAQAQDFLAERTSEVIGDVIPLITELEGGWHPLGFAAFQLMVLEDGSSLRLHVWPEDLRRGHSLERPAIHDHAWHLISKIITPAPYQDTRYDVQVVSDAPSTEEERISSSRGLQRVFRAYYPPGPQELRTDGTCAQVRAIEEVVVQSGQYNRIVAGEYHLDNIPIGLTVATLCLDSPKLIDDGPHVIIDGPADTIKMGRVPIPPEDLRYIRGALQKAVA